VNLREYIHDRYNFNKYILQFRHEENFRDKHDICFVGDKLQLVTYKISCWFV